MPENDKKPVDRTGLREVGWFIALWCLGVGAVLIVGQVIRLVIGG